MSIKKKKDLFDVDMKKEIFETLKEKKLDFISIILLSVLWVIGFTFYDVSLYQLLMIIFSVVYVIRFYYVSIKSETQNRIYYDLLNSSEDFKLLADKYRKEQEKEVELQNVTEEG